jgi:hypothetical protein
MDDPTRYLRTLLDAASPAPWDKLTYGNASVAKVAGQMARSAYATARDAGVPMTDLTEIGAPNGRLIAYTGNGPHSPENGAAIAALRNAAPWLLDVASAAFRLLNRIDGDSIDGEDAAWEDLRAALGGLNG